MCNYGICQTGLVPSQAQPRCDSFAAELSQNPRPCQAPSDCPPLAGGGRPDPALTGTQNIRTQLSSEIFAHANFFPGTFIQPLNQDRGGAGRSDCQPGP